MIQLLQQLSDVSIDKRERERQRDKDQELWFRTEEDCKVRRSVRKRQTEIRVD